MDYHSFWSSSRQFYRCIWNLSCTLVYISTKTSSAQKCLGAITNNIKIITKTWYQKYQKIVHAMWEPIGIVLVSLSKQHSVYYYSFATNAINLYGFLYTLQAFYKAICKLKIRSLQITVLPFQHFFCLLPHTAALRNTIHAYYFRLRKRDLSVRKCENKFHFDVLIVNLYWQLVVT